MRRILDRIYAEWTTSRVLVTLLVFDVTVLSAAVYLETVTHLQFFKEGYPMTWLSAFHLLAVALTAWKTFERRDPEGSRMHWKAWFSRLDRPTSVWLLIAAGFVFLTLDEMLMLHELADIIIHFVFSIEANAVTDRLDDVLVLLYLIPGVIALVYYWQELFPFRKAAFYLSLGMLCAMLMVAADIITNQNDIIPLFIEGTKASDRVFNLLKLFEESMKVLAEAFFIGALYFCYEKAGTLPQAEAPAELKQAA